MDDEYIRVHPRGGILVGAPRAFLMTTSSTTRFSLDGNLRFVDGALMIEGISAISLASRFGTPLHILSETQLRENYRRFVEAFRSRWADSSLDLNYSIKANPALAVRQVLSEEGAGGDCNGLYELRLALAGGVDPSKTNLNGNNKTQDAIDFAVEVGARINVDSPSEFDASIAASHKYRRVARIGLRIKPDLVEFGVRESEVRAPGTLVRDYANMNKWGLSEAMATAIVRQALESDRVVLEGIHYHLGRQIGDPTVFALMIPGVFRFLDAVRRRTGWTPDRMNLGGGFTQGRDPFARARRLRGRWPDAADSTADPIEHWAEVVVSTLRRELDRRDLPPPALEFECGRFLVANAGTTLTRVGSVKTIGRRVWVNVDLAGSQVGLSRAPANAHAIVAAQQAGTDKSRMKRCDVVGPLCTLDLLAQGLTMPIPATGDYLAILDTGAYADSEASTSNSIPRLEVVLVRGSSAEPIRVRETFEEVLRRDRIPTWLHETAKTQTIDTADRPGASVPYEPLATQ
jgi:diaminopimelate decarboxylase